MPVAAGNEAVAKAEERVRKLVATVADLTALATAVRASEDVHADAALMKSLRQVYISGNTDIVPKLLEKISTCTAQIADGREEVVAARRQTGCQKVNTVLMTYDDGSRILDDGKTDPKTAFAQQLVWSNMQAPADLAKIVDIDTVVEAFRISLRLAKSDVLVVCIDGLPRLRSHLRECKGLNEAAAESRCLALRASLTAYEEECTRLGKPEVRFLWTSMTAHLEAAKGVLKCCTRT
eukprot:Rhum_TRINITY_DN6181_c0_g1::Rhum_TRINITY_DN6181_c0_g1_i1::g.19303::m.19303